jgi:hypothetical protein
MANISALVVKIAADASELTKELDKIAAGGSKSAAAMERAGKIMGGALLAAASAAIYMTVQAGKYAEQLDQVSQKTGIAVNDLQDMTVALARNGLNLDSLVTANRKLSDVITESRTPYSQSARLLNELGITARSVDGVMEQLADVFTHMPDGAGKTSIAIALLGKSGQELIPILNKAVSRIRRGALWSSPCRLREKRYGIR